MKKLDITNQKFNRLFAIRFLYKNKNNESIWLFICNCGNIIETSASRVKCNKVKSCGCLHKETSSINGQNNIKHGLTSSGIKPPRLYNIWRDIKARCYNKNSINYKDYGGRGIIMCDEWKNDFQSFYTWSISNGYQDNLQINRIDNNGHYEINNCNWITSLENSNNKRNNKYYIFNNKIQTISQWSRELNVEKSVLRKRIIKNNNTLNENCLRSK